MSLRQAIRRAPAAIGWDGIGALSGLAVFAAAFLIFGGM